EACHALAVRFHQGGKLVVFGTGASSTDAQHVAVEFVHPVIVGKRALPAISLTTDVATVTGIAEREGMNAIFSHQLRYLAAPSDIALGICATGDCGSVLAGLAVARQLGMLTIALAGGDGGASAAGPAGPLRRSPGGQGDARHHVPPAVGTGARLLRAAGGPEPGGVRMIRRRGRVPA